MQRAELIQYARYPLGKAAYRAEIKQELRRAKAMLKRVPYKVGIGRAVAQERECNVYHVAPQFRLFPPYYKRMQHVKRFGIKFFYPVGKAKHSYVLGVAASGCNIPDIGQLFVVLHALLAVAVAPFVYVL